MTEFNDGLLVVEETEADETNADGFSAEMKEMSGLRTQDGETIEVCTEGQPITVSGGSGTTITADTSAFKIVSDTSSDVSTPVSVNFSVKQGLR